MAGEIGSGINAGLGAVNLAQNWDTMSPEQRAQAGLSTASSAAQLAGTSIPGVSTINTALNVDKIYNNWGKMGNEQRAVAATSLAAGGAAAAGYAIPGVNVALAAYGGAKMTQQGYNTYWKGGTTGQKAGFAAGSIAFGSAIPGVFSVMGGMFKSGKPQDQKIRDAFRKDLIGKGLYNDDFTMTLADGTKADVGLDGGATHKTRFMDRVVGDKGDGSVKAYNIDYTNDLDYVSGMAGTTLTRLLYGGRDDHIDQTGFQIGNAMLGKVGYGQDMSSGNFSNVMNNARGVFAKAGISSKEDAYKLLDRASKEGRLTTADQIVAQQSLAMIYDGDKGYDMASKLMQGRWVGADKLKDIPPRTPTVVNPTVPAKAGAVGTPINLFKQPLSQVMNIDTRQAQPQNAKALGADYKSNLLADKQDIRARNLAKYGQADQEAANG